MQLAQVLDVLEALFAGCGHPEIATVARYGGDLVPGGPSPAGVRVRYRNQAEAYLWGAIWPGESPLPTPEVLPPPTWRADRIAVFAVHLLDVARPEQFRSWQVVALTGLGPEHQRGKVPRGVRIECADGTSVLLRATSAGGPEREPDSDPYPTWKIPETLSAGGRPHREA
ncbi:MULTISPECIES: hypothetical protein [Actinoplanes]|uniref:hypothetical protein n=1 Tax=Actinoplanes TaxID=1865 RepID=UPI0005F2A1DD|nr:MULTISPECIES: hypothetical protein [Actinoplanes]GLY07405.1 hypothetical protein Acsp01_77840 [Actinoplanes sp. NBRC 101535]